MSFVRTALARLEQAHGLDPAAAAVAGVVRRSVPGPAVADALYGVWLGHPVHPLAGQVPLGAWLSASVLDACPAPGWHDLGPLDDLPRDHAEGSHWSVIDPSS